MKKMIIMSLVLLSSTFAFAETKDVYYPSVTLNVGTSPEIAKPFCVVQILQPELSGYDWTVSADTRGDGTLTYFPYKNTTLTEYIQEMGDLAGHGWAHTPAIKSLSIPYFIRYNDNSTAKISRIVSASVNSTNDGTQDQSVLSLGHLLPIAEGVDTLLLGIPGAINSVGNGVINRWNQNLANLRQRARNKKLLKASQVTDLAISNALTVMARAEVVLLTQYACADQKNTIQGVNLAVYLNNLSSALEDLQR